MDINKNLKQIEKNFKLKKFNDVILQCRKVIKKNANNFILNQIIGLAYFYIKNFDLSIKYLKKASEINPSDMVCKNNLANSYKSFGNSQEAEKIYKEILRKFPNNPIILQNLALIKKNISDFSSSIDLYKKSMEYLESEENKIRALINIASNYTNLGEFSKAKEIFTDIIKKNPNNVTAHVELGKLIDYKKDNTRLNLLVDLLNQENLEKLDRSQLCFAIGKGYESIDNYDESYKYLIKANEIQDEVNNYDMSNNKKLLITNKAGKELKNIFQKENFDHINKSCSIKKIIFICGMPRSGTTLAQQIIASHNKVVGAGELTYLEQIIKKLFFEDGKLSLKKIKDSFKSKENILNNEYFKLLNFHGYDKSIIIDKAPANFFWIGFINYFFPNCKIIHCYRKAEDNLLSLFKNYFPSKNMSWSSNLTNTVEYYNLYSSLIKFWNQLFKNKIYNLSYETLVSDSPNEIKKILNYCDLEWDDNCLQHHKNFKTPIATVSLTEARRPIYKSSVNFSKNYADHLAEFFAKLDKIS
jgi:Tfp pilus assembly protein PilF